MARLHEFQGKALLAKHNIPVPCGRQAATPEEARAIAGEIGKPVMVKMQAWVTGRAGMGGIKKASTPDEAADAAAGMLGRRVKNFNVDWVLVEEQIQIEREFYAGIIVDDVSQSPIMIFSSVGGTGIEEIAVEHPDKVAKETIDVVRGLQDYQARDLARRAGVEGKLLNKLAGTLVQLWKTAQDIEARAAEINPLVLTADGKLLAADCRVTVDDYAVFRHKDLGIEIAREMDRPPTELERIAYAVEADDYRGTFFFLQIEEDYAKGDKVVGFHGAGGGGSMMSMDAVLGRGYKLANFVDTSGNPPASKVYRAAKIILSQPGLDGYFGSGSGVASQEQFHSARGLVKAFLEEPLSVPAVIRLGGNAEDQAVEILESVNGIIPAPVEGYKKDNSPDYCAEKLDVLINEYTPPVEIPAGRAKPTAAQPYTFETVTGGTVTLDHALCADCKSKICVQTCARKILSLNENGLPELNITREEAKKGRCVECLACDVECFFHGNKGGFVELPIPGLDAYREKIGIG
ncbi:MAG: acetate--CoA ligase family protein [Anaerolineales bacterium]|nr:acetate--CoA ligase family protein [Anaerolineales bacterium]